MTESTVAAWLWSFVLAFPAPVPVVELPAQRALLQVAAGTDRLSCLGTATRGAGTVRGVRGELRVTPLAAVELDTAAAAGSSSTVSRRFRTDAAGEFRFELELAPIDAPLAFLDIEVSFRSRRRVDGLLVLCNALRDGGAASLERAGGVVGP